MLKNVNDMFLMFERASLTKPYLTKLYSYSYLLIFSRASAQSQILFHFAGATARPYFKRGNQHFCGVHEVQILIFYCFFLHFTKFNIFLHVKFCEM